MTPPDATDRRKVSAFRDPMSKTLVAALVGIVSITALCMTALACAMAGVPIDGTVSSVLLAMGGNIMGCVGVVASRAQGGAPPAKSSVSPDV